MEAVLGFFSRQEEDLPDACSHRSGGSAMFRKPSPVSPLGALCLEIADLNEIRSCAPMFLSDCLVSRLISEGALQALLAVTIMWHDFSVHAEDS
jgi:hypothetical protein